MTISNPTLSVIIPTYNRAHLLSQAIKSVQQQSGIELETIIVDDGSVDHTKDIIDRLGDNVRYFYQNHRGLNAARNLALTQSRGQYIALLDDDDLWLPWKSQLQIHLLEAYPEAAFIFSNFYIFSETRPVKPRGLETWFPNDIDWSNMPGEIIENNELDHLSELAPAPFWIFKGIFYEALLFNPYVLPSTAIFRKRHLNNLVGFPENNTHCGDWAFFAFLAKKQPCLYMDIETALNRSHDDPVRLTRRKPSERLVDRIDLIERVWQIDPDFMEVRGNDLQELKANELLRLSYYLLLEDRKREALSTLERIDCCLTTKQTLAKIVIFAGARIPGGVQILQLLIGLKKLKRLVLK